MGLLTDLPIRQVFKHARRLRVGEASPPSLQPLRGAAAAGRGAGAAPLRPGRPPAGPARDAGGVLPRVAPDGHRRHGPRRPRLGRPTPPPSAAPRRGRAATGPSPRSASSAWSSWGPTSRSPSSCKPCHSDERAMVAGLLRHLDPGDAPALGPGLLQLRAVAAAGGARGEAAGAGRQVADPAADPRAGRRLVPGQDLPERLRPAEGPRRDHGPGDPVHARRPATGRPRRGARPDHQPAR